MKLAKLCLSLLIISSCTHSNIEKNEGVSVEVPINATPEQIVELATEVRPSYRQLDYQQREMLGFIHIGMNTFTGAEWGTGKESPAIFNPKDLDVEEWVKTFKDAGITAVILVCKHHDGFCVWPSKYTIHTVKYSPWREGKGDLVRDVAEACKKHNMKLCLYLSPWDMHEQTYGTDAYNDYYIHQVEELLSNYGPIYLLWLDGAGLSKETSGKEMKFDWTRIFKRARELQPDILLSGSGPDIRWVGNEAGKGRETEWCVQGINDTNILFGGRVEGLDDTAESLGSIEQLMSKKKLVWYPSRGGLPLRKGWFYNPNDDHTTKSIKYLINSYFSTVGQNSNLLPNLSPDKSGRFPAKDAKRLVEFGKMISEMKKTDYALGCTAKSLYGWGKPHEANLLTDQDPFTSWQTPKGVVKAGVEIKLEKKNLINVIKLQENVRDFGQRIESFSVETFVDGQWKEIAASTTIGYRKMILLKEAIYTDLIRIHVLNSRTSVSLGNVSLYYLPPIQSEKIESDKRMPLTNSGWKTTIYNITSQSPISFLTDNNNSTYYKCFINNYPFGIIVDFKESQQLSGFSYSPDNRKDAGHLENYKIYLSNDGKEWGNPLCTGRFGNIINNPVEQYLSFKPTKARFAKLEFSKTTSDTISIPSFTWYK